MWIVFGDEHNRHHPICIFCSLTQTWKNNDQKLFVTLKVQNCSNKIFKSILLKYVINQKIIIGYHFGAPKRQKISMILIKFHTSNTFFWYFSNLKKVELTWGPLHLIVHDSLLVKNPNLNFVAIKCICPMSLIVNPSCPLPFLDSIFKYNLPPPLDVVTQWIIFCGWR